MTHEEFVEKLLKWLEGKESDSGDRLEKAISKDNKANHDHFRGREVAYGNVIAFIKALDKEI